MLGAARVTAFWIALALFGAACELAHAAVIALPSRLSSSYRRRFHHRLWNRLIRAWGRTAFALLRGLVGVEVDVEGHVPAGRHLVVVNHQSTAEIAVLFEVLRAKNLKFVAKEELFSRIPNVSRALRSGGFGLVSFGSPRASLRGLAEFCAGLPSWDGSPVIYPEGRRTTDGSLAPFQRGGIEVLARETRLPILPVVIDGLWRARSVREFFTRLPGSRCRVRILPPIDPESAANAEDLTGLLEGTMRVELDSARSRLDSARSAEVPRKGRLADVLEMAALIASGYACHLYYNVIGHLASLRGIDRGPLLLTSVDRSIPYLPVLVLFYQIAYFVPGIAVALVLTRIGPAVAAVRRIVASFLLLLVAHYSLYLLVPASASAIRLPDAALGTGFLADAVRVQYRLATIWCAWPSLHASACWFFYRVLARELPRLRLVYLFWFLGMLAGTAAIKIHYALDSVTGLLLAEAAYRGVLVRLEGSGALRWTWRSDTLRLVVHWSIVAALVAGIPLAMRASGYAGPLYVIAPGR